MPTGPRSPSNKPPSLLAIAALAALSFGGFVYTVRQREQEAKRLPPTEQRRQHENPLLPPRHNPEPVT